MKRILILALVLATVLALFASCGKDKDPQEDPKTPGGSSETEKKEEPKPSYTISFYDENGDLLKADKYDENAVPSYSYNKADTAEWDYTVEGFAATAGGEVLSALPAATANASYYAIVSKVKQTYTLTFNSNGGSGVSAVTVDYGTQIAAPTNPTREGYRFVSWCTDSALNTAVTWPITLTGNQTVFAKWNEKVDIPALLSTLLDGADISPYAYIPEVMQAKNHTITSEKAALSYASAVSVGNIPTNGFGEQWSMIIDNIEQSQTFFSVLSIVETLSSTAVAAFNNYLDKNPGETADYSFKESIYSVDILYDGEKLDFVVGYTANLPVLGEQTVEIYLSLDVSTGEKKARIQLGEANALSYTVTENSYTFAIKYLGVRTAMASFVKDQKGNISGTINEYLTIAGKGLHSAADFMMTDQYIIAVGNKADGMIGFTGYICEVYDKSTGKMIGYEVMETLSSITYNTLWFQLADIGGLTSIRHQEKTDTVDEAYFVNGSASAWQVKTVGGLNLKTLSRRYDIEFRSQYFYTYNAEAGQYEKVEVKVPMMFIQAEQFETFAEDVKAKNSTLTLSVNLSSAKIKAITDAYAADVPAFIEHKEAVTEDAIKAMIGSKYSKS